MPTPKELENLRYLVIKLNDGCVLCGSVDNIGVVAKELNIDRATTSKLLAGIDAKFHQEIIDKIEWWIWKILNKKELIND